MQLCYTSERISGERQEDYAHVVNASKTKGKDQFFLF